MLDKSGRGGFLTGSVISVSPLQIKLNDKLTLDEDDLYITDNCIGVTGHHSMGGVCNIRPPLAVGNSVLLISKPNYEGSSKYILLDRIQPYTVERRA